MPRKPNLLNLTGLLHYGGDENEEIWADALAIELLTRKNKKKKFVNLIIKTDDVYFQNGDKVFRTIGELKKATNYEGNEGIRGYKDLVAFIGFEGRVPIPLDILCSWSKENKFPKPQDDFLQFRCSASSSSSRSNMRSSNKDISFSGCFNNDEHDIYDDDVYDNDDHDDKEEEEDMEVEEEEEEQNNNNNNEIPITHNLPNNNNNNSNNIDNYESIFYNKLDQIDSVNLLCVELYNLTCIEFAAMLNLFDMDRSSAFKAMKTVTGNDDSVSWESIPGRDLIPRIRRSPLISYEEKFEIYRRVKDFVTLHEKKNS